MPWDRVPRPPEYLCACLVCSAYKHQLKVMWRKALIKRFNPGTAGHLPTNFSRLNHLNQHVCSVHVFLGGHLITHITGGLTGG